MLSAEQIVSSWLEGSDTEAGMASPAGPMLVGGLAAADTVDDGVASILATKGVLCDISVPSGTCFG